MLQALNLIVGEEDGYFWQGDYLFFIDYYDKLDIVIAYCPQDGVPSSPELARLKEDLIK